MNRYEVIPLRSQEVISEGDSVFETLMESLEKEEIALKEGDIVVVTSKVVSMEQGRHRKLDDVEVSPEAETLAKLAGISAELAQLIIEESEEILGAVRGVVLTRVRYGLLPNAGVDESNAPQGEVTLLPEEPGRFAEHIRERIRERWGIDTGVIITDSNVVPLRRGTLAISLGTAGLESVIDQRGQKDLFGREMRLTTLAVADSLATAANLVMGETSELVPFALIRGLNLPLSGQEVSCIMPMEECLFYSPLVLQKANLHKEEGT